MAIEEGFESTKQTTHPVPDGPGPSASTGHRPGRLARQGSLHVLITLTAAPGFGHGWDGGQQRSSAAARDSDTREEHGATVETREARLIGGG